MNPVGWLILYVLLVVAASMAGGVVPVVVRLTHRRMQLTNSAIGGFMVAVALLVLLPHALAAVSVDVAMMWVLVGLLVMFFLERFFSHHHHDASDLAAVTAPDAAAPPHVTGAADAHHEHGPHIEPTHHHHGHPHHHAHPHSHPLPIGRHLLWLGPGLGLAVHGVIDGVTVAAGVAGDTLAHGEATSGNGLIPPGLPLFLIVALHRPLDSMTLLALTARGGYRPLTRHLINLAFAMTVPLGAVLFMLGVSGESVENSVVVGCGLAFAVGVVLCVALSDLLPELQFHRHDRIKLSVSLGLGLALGVGVYLLDAAGHGHEHGHAEHPASAQAEDDERSHAPADSSNRLDPHHGHDH